MQWFGGSMPDRGVRGPRFKSHRGQLCLSRQPLRYTALGMGCAPLLQFLGSLSLPPPWDSKIMSAFGLDNNNKWRWWMWMVAAYQRIHGPCWLAWFEGWLINSVTSLPKGVCFGEPNATQPSLEQC